MKLLANKVHIQRLEVLMADKVHKQEPQHVGVKHIATRCGSCLCTLLASNTFIPCM